MAQIHLTIVTPKGRHYDGEARRIVVRTKAGDVCIMPRHIDFAAALGEGEARVTEPDGKVRRAEVHGGMLHVAADNVQVVTNGFAWTDE